MAFDLLARRVATWSGGIVLDSGCGTGKSTAGLAAKYPQHLIIGVDKSIVRLSRAKGLPENAITTRIDLEDFWRLASEAGWRFVRQCVFYPNPWPKPEHRLRRWPFHPVFPTALSCGGVWELRTNWKVYADEFALAYGLLCGTRPEVLPWTPVAAETLFEAKYLESGHELWRCETRTSESAETRR